ncbi:uncharacterized protein [Misgurnus anguillicaudatus]|uniref:uncharacterized protein n=1 Tax=Misgurnus anguillicaudatus TaxID=75329 RepID=UPI003CCF4BF5
MVKKEKKDKPIHKTTRVFGDEVKSVSVMEGHSVTLNTDITEIKRGDVILWKFGPQESLIVNINRAANKTSINDDVLDGRFRDRLQVNDHTGDLTITNIKTKHTGFYQINIRGIKEISCRFNVIVYARLPVPVITRDYSQCSNCSLLCSVLNVTHVSLSWYKGNSLLSIISVSDLNIRLSLPLEVEYQDNTKYGCMVNNTITNQTQHLNIKNLCQMCSDRLIITIIRICCAVGCLMIVALVLICCICRKRKNTKQQVETASEEEITYANPAIYTTQVHETRAPVEDDVVYTGIRRR